jgi:DNA polymerase-3 subunit beta
MDVVLDRDQLLRGLQMVQNIVEPRQTLPILANMLVEAEADVVRVTATDLEVGARVTIPAQVRTAGTLTVPGRKLAEIVRELPAASLTLKSANHTGAVLRCAGVSYRLVAMPPDDFPAVVPAAPAAWLRMEASVLRSMLVRTSYAVSHDESRFALNGVLFVAGPKEVRLVATDGHRLAVATAAVTQGLSGVTGIVPRKAVVEISRVLAGADEVEWAITENQFVMQWPGFVMTARLIEGQFPNWEAVVPRQQPARLVVRRSALMAALRRVSLVAEERNRPVRLLLGSGKLTLAAASHDVGEAEEALDVAYTGEELLIGFNCRYLLEALTPMEEGDVALEFKDPLSPALVRAISDETYCCVIMPMRV